MSFCPVCFTILNMGFVQYGSVYRVTEIARHMRVRIFFDL